MAKDLRGFLAEYEKKNPKEFCRVKREVDPKFEVAAILTKLEEARKLPILFYEKVKGSNFPVVANVYSTKKKIASSIGIDPRKFRERYIEAIENQIPPRVVSDGPVMDETIKEKDVDIGEIAHQLGVQYIVEGSVRRSGKRVRITVQLVDALSGSEVWADRYDRDLDDIFVVQDEVVAAIVGALPSRVRLAELERADRRPMDLRAYDLAQRAWQLLYQWTKAGIETATELAERALEIDPKNGSAHAVLVGVQLLNWRRCWRGSPAETLDSALTHGRSAVELDETEYTGHWYLSEVYLFRLKDLEQAKVHAERAIKLCPNASGPLAWMGLINGCSGEHQAGIEFCNRALRLDPFAPDYLQYLAGCVHFNARNYEEAIKHLHATQWLSKPELLSATYVHIGRINEAQNILASHTDSIAVEMKRMPDDWFTYFAERCPFVGEENIAHYLSALEAALE